MRKKPFLLGLTVLFLVFPSMISVVSATNPVKMIKGERYDGQGTISCGYYHVSGPLHVVVNEETGEISAWGRHSYYLVKNWGMSSAPGLSVIGTITGKEEDDNGFRYFFSFNEHWHLWNLRGGGTGWFRYRPDLDEFVVHLKEG